jgi:hypothetical protein
MRTGRNPGTAGITKDARAKRKDKDKACLSREQVVILNSCRDCNDWGEAIYCSSEDAMQLMWIFGQLWSLSVVRACGLREGAKKE